MSMAKQSDINDTHLNISHAEAPSKIHLPSGNNETPHDLSWIFPKPKCRLGRKQEKLHPLLQLLCLEKLSWLICLFSFWRVPTYITWRQKASFKIFCLHFLWHILRQSRKWVSNADRPETFATSKAEKFTANYYEIIRSIDWMNEKANKRTTYRDLAESTSHKVHDRQLLCGSPTCLFTCLWLMSFPSVRWSFPSQFHPIT